MAKSAGDGCVLGKARSRPCVAFSLSKPRGSELNELPFLFFLAFSLSVWCDSLPFGEAREYSVHDIVYSHGEAQWHQTGSLQGLLLWLLHLYCGFLVWL